MHNPEWGAPIVSFDEFDALRPKLGKIVATSGGFDPIHPGHISCIIQSKQYGDTLVVIVNGDTFLTAKKGRAFQNLETRSLIVSGIIGVDYVVPFEIKDDQTVSKALEAIRPDVFTKGGDRADKASLPEWETCRRHNIEIVFGVGEEKQWSSSWFLNRWNSQQ
ncbi:MAG TPA: adenylyltransferase/cytidyltransferase family protein [Candidatus Saccharimonadales bacterium]|nr:adenylyltransferase/cytidyltransferase family protein [Candidatus Saccharimonadales bacterium]